MRQELREAVKGKKYSKEHILQMLAVYSLKNTLTITQIKRILSGIAESGGGAKELADCFNTQLERRAVISSQLMASVEQMTKETNMTLDTPEAALSFLLTLTDLTDTLTAFASAITQKCFPEPPEKPGKKKSDKKSSR